ncbi:MAG: tripartite tricarboxylate transporter TctB family protein, partial [Desulfobacterales bacterium]|nr:tripartite tricarboxylate transporter TctB family protein [Desulfobacterales bacterium]
KKADMIISIILMGFCLFFSYLTWRLPERNLPNTLGVSFMPWVLVICLGVLSAILLVKSVFGGPREDHVAKIHIEEAAGVLFLAALIIAYIFLLKYFGFLLCTPLLIALLMIANGARQWREVVLTSALTTIGVYLFFRKIFLVMLPEGSFF